MKEEIEFINQNENGDWYVGYKIPVTRGIRGKTKGKVNELLIIGIPKKNFPKWCKKHNIYVEIKDQNGNIIEEINKHDKTRE